MGFLFLINGMSYLAVSILAFYAFLYFYNKGRAQQRIGSIIGVNGIFYLIFSFLLMSWLFGLLNPIEEDFLIMTFALTSASSVLLLYLVYKITSNRNLIYLFILYLVTVFSIILSLSSFFLFSMLASYLLMVIVFLDVIFYSNYHLKRAGVFGLVYVLFCTLFLALDFFNFDYVSLPWFIPGIFMFLVLYFIFKDVKELKILKDIKPKSRKNFILGSAEVYIKFMIFIVSISSFIFISTISVHELGHVMVAKFYECEHTKAVIYGIMGAAHTEIQCSSYYNNTLLTLSGLFSTLAISLIFFLTGGGFTKRLSFLILGFSLLIMYGDLRDLHMSSNIIVAVIFLSLIIVTLSVLYISRHYLKNQHFLSTAENESQERPKHKSGKSRL